MLHVELNNECSAVFVGLLQMMSVLNGILGHKEVPFSTRDAGQPEKVAIE